MLPAAIAKNNYYQYTSISTLDQSAANIIDTIDKAAESASASPMSKQHIKYRSRYHESDW